MRRFTGIFNNNSGGKLMRTFSVIKLSILILFILVPLTLQAQWVQTNVPSDVEVLDFFSEGSSVFCGTTRSGLFTSNDGGATWAQFADHKILSYGGFEYLDGSLFCVVGGAGVHVSTDLGTTWKDANSGLPAATTSTMVSCGGNLFALVLSGGIYRSADKGASWASVTSGLDAGNSLVTIAAAGNTLYAAQYMKDMYKSTDQGQTWNLVKLADSSPSVFSITSCNGVPFALSAGKGMFYSKDNGQTWLTFKNMSVNDFAYDGGNYYVSGFDGKNWGIFGFKLGDSTYTPLNNGLPLFPNINKIYNNGKYMFAAVKNNGSGTDKSGVYRIEASQLIATGVENSIQVRPEKFELMQNYPNPFNPSTTITYSLPEAGHVKLAVYSLLGKEVSTLVDEFQNADVHSVKFDAGSLPSGIYLYKIESGSFSAYKKLILMK